MTVLALALTVLTAHLLGARTVAFERTPITDGELRPSAALVCTALGVWTSSPRGWRLLAHPSFRALRFVCTTQGELFVVGGEPGVYGALAHFDAHGRLREERRYARDLIYDIALDEGERALALACADGRVLWLALSNLEHPTERARHGAAARAVCFAPHDGRLASAGLDGRILIRDRSPDVPPRDIQDHLQGVECLSFSADGERLASGARDGRVRIYDRGGRALLFADPLPAAVTALRYGGTSGTLRAAVADGSLHELDPKTQRWRTLAPATGRPRRVLLEDW